MENQNNYRMRLRSSTPKEEREEQMRKKQEEKELEKNKPPIVFKGKINYIREFVDCAMMCDNLIKRADEASDTLVLGFDIEWPFSFQTGSGKASLVQISPGLEVCYLIQISDIKTLPKGFPLLLEHPKVRITGVNIKNDIRKLARDFSGFNGDKIIENCIDSGVYANRLLPFKQRWSMEKLVGYLLKMSINKDKKVRMSKWHVSPLNKEQLLYAATDAYASLVLYQELRKREERQEDENIDSNNVL